MPEGKGKSAHLFRSDDGGATLVEVTPPLAHDGRLFVSAVDPRDADRVYLRELSETGSDVLLSTDGGKSFASVLHLKGAMFGFAATHDGSVVYAGSGDAAEGIWRSVDRGATWEQGAKTPVFCLNAEGPKLLVCSNPFVPGGYAVAESADRGATVKPLATFDDVLGPLECSDAGDPCAASWPETRARIAASANRPPPPRAALEAGGDDGDARADAIAPAPGRSTSACGCAAAPARDDRGALLGLVITLGGLAARRRSRTRPASSTRNSRARIL